MLTVYAKKILATDNSKRYDVAIYRRPSAKIRDRLCIFPYFYKSCPTKRNKFVTINCYRWKIKWLTAKAEARSHD